MAAVADFTALLEKLPESSDKLIALRNIETYLTVKNRQELAELSKNVSFNLIFECLSQSTSSEEIQVCCHVLEKLLSASDVSTLLQQYHDELLHGLAHPQQQVQLLCLKQVRAVCESSGQLLANSSTLVSRLLEMLGENLQSASLASKCLVLLGSSEEGLDVLLSDQCFRSLHALLDTSDTIRYRLYQLVVELAAQSPQSLSRWTACGIIARCVGDLQREDVLVQMNCLELLTQLAESHHGLEYLEGQGVVVRLENMLRMAEEDPMAGFLMPGLIKFFGHLGAQHPKEVNGRLADFMTCVFNCCNSPDPTLKIIAIETVAFIGQSADGKQALIKLGSGPVGEAVKAMGASVREGSTEYKTRAIDAVTRLITLKVHEQTEELLQATRLWFSQLGPDPMTLLEGLLKQPALAVRCAAFRLLTAVTSCHWGQELIDMRAGFNEYLLDRSTEQEKDSKEAKYEVVKTLVDSPTAMDVFGRVYFVKLKEYVNEGPYYIKTETQVAFEGE